MIPDGYDWLAINVSRIVACWRLETISPFPHGHFGTLHLHGRLYPLPLLLACFRTYASSSLLPYYLQGSILGLWLAVTETGLSPARICDIAQPQPKPDPVLRIANAIGAFALLFLLSHCSYVKAIYINIRNGIIIFLGFFILL